MKRITIQDVARVANVSITTVSRYLNQRFDFMSEETRQRIAAAIQQLDYQPNTLAQGLKGSRSRMIAVVVVNIQYPLCVSVLRSMSETCAPAGYSLLVCETQGDAALERKLLENLRGQQVEAMVIQTNGDNNDFIATIASTVPVVLMDRQFTMPGVTNIITNNHHVSYQLTKQLFEQGYQKVLYLTEPVLQISTRRDRLQGYEEACRDVGRDPWIAWMDRHQASTAEAAVAQLGQSDRSEPCAVYAANGLIMLNVYPLLYQLGRTIPQELGIAMFDEPDWIKVVTPGLTCVRQPTDEIGQLSARTILRLLEETARTQEDSAQTFVLNSEILMNDSTNRHTTQEGIA